MTKITARTVAEAICRTSERAGQSHDVADPQSVEERVENLLRVGPYGAYIVDGDPNGWGGMGTLATVYMEQHGGPGDCELPLEYYGDGMEVSIAASERLPRHSFIEFVNAAVAVAVDGQPLSYSDSFERTEER